MTSSGTPLSRYDDHVDVNVKGNHRNRYLQLLQHFADDLVAVRTKVVDALKRSILSFDGVQVTLLLSDQDENLVGDNMDYKETAATKLLKVNHKGTIMMNNNIFADHQSHRVHEPVDKPRDDELGGVPH